MNLDIGQWIGLGLILGVPLATLIAALFGTTRREALVLLGVMVTVGALELLGLLLLSGILP
jgi:hypothetical protein